MHHTRFLFVLLGFAALGFAADPFVGTWKLNSAKTKYTTGAAPKEQTVTIAATGSDLDITIGGTAADGTAIPHTTPCPQPVERARSLPHHMTA